jgi:capsular polysaccharide biosynthesis protein
MQEKGTQQVQNNQVPSQDDEVEIDLGEIFGLLLHWIWLILLVGVAFAVVAYSVCRFVLPEEFQSTTSVYILDKSDSNNNSSTTYSDLQVGTQLTNDYAEIIKSRSVVEAVIANLGLDEDYDSLSRKIEVTTPTDTRIVTITVTDHDPSMAQKIANEVRDQATKQITSVMAIDAVNVVDQANLPTEKSAPHNTRDAAVAAIIGMLLVSVILIVRYLMDDTIKTSEDIEKYLELPTLALVPMDEAIEVNSMEHVAKQGKRKRSKAPKKKTPEVRETKALREPKEKQRPARRTSAAKTRDTDSYEEDSYDIFDIDVESDESEEGRD